MKYEIYMPVCETIHVIVEADNEEEARKKAVEKAIEEQPQVYWTVDEFAEWGITEVEGD